MSDRQFVGLFLCALGLAVLLGPLWGSEWGKIATRCVDEAIGVGQITAGFLIVLVSIMLVAQGLRLLFRF